MSSSSAETNQEVGRLKAKVATLEQKVKKLMNQVERLLPENNPPRMDAHGRYD